MIFLLSFRDFSDYIQSVKNSMHVHHGITMSVDLSLLERAYSSWAAGAKNSIQTYAEPPVRNNNILHSYKVMDVLRYQLGNLCAALCTYTPYLYDIVLKPRKKINSLYKNAMRLCPQHFFAILVCSKLYKAFMRTILGVTIVINDKVMGDLIDLCMTSKSNNSPSSMMLFHQLMTEFDNSK